MDQLEGCSETEVRNAKISDNSFPTDDRNKIFFLYNVKTGLLLNAGGYWGTHVSLKEFGMPLWIHIDSGDWIHLAQKFDKTGTGAEEGNYVEYEYASGKDNTDIGAYVDRGYINGTTIIKRGWKLEAVSGKTNTYKLYTYRNESNYPTTSPYFTTTKYYLAADKAQGDVDKNCGAYLSSDIESGYDEWKFISYQQLFELQEEKTEKMTSSLDLTFRLSCPGFSRENASLSNWKTYKYGGSGNIRFGLEHFYKTSTENGVDYTDDWANGKISRYSFPDGSDQMTFTERNDYERHCGKYYCADVKNARGAIYQDIEVAHGGAYVIECKAFSTTKKARLFAVLLDDNGNVNTNTLHSTIVGQTQYMSNAEKTSLHISEQNMDYAGKEFYGNHKYFSSVLVQVPEGGGKIRFGIEIGTTSDTKPEADDEWTVFDDFRLLYASKTTDGDLVLDQDRDNLDYLATCSNTYSNITLHLNKTFTKDKWNSFVLPVDLTRDQLTQAFGPNVKLAKLNKLTQTEIQFETIDVNAKEDNEVVMKAYEPYIIQPTKHLDDEITPPYMALLSKTGNDEAKDVKVIVKRNHIDIPNVSLATCKDASTSAIINDLTKMNTSNWTTNASETVGTNGQPSVIGDGTLTAYGTFARTFGEATQNTNSSDTNYGKWNITTKNILDGRDDLTQCYFFDQGNMYHSTNRPRGLRGFSVWFRPTKNASTEAKFYLDGVYQEGTTDIQDILGDNQGLGSQAANTVYNLQGQIVRQGSSSLVGLPKGVYIIGGKKYLVK